MTDLALQALQQQVLWAALALGVVFGAIAQRTHFCTMGAVADVVNIGDWTRMRMWALAAGVAMMGFNAMVALGWLKASNSVYAAPALLWASHLVGGLMFGVGMVLASGCGSKTLVRIGGGNLKSLVVFGVIGLSAWATLRGITAVLRRDCHRGVEQPRAVQVRGQAMLARQRRGCALPVQRHHLAAKGVFQGQQAGAGEVHVIGLDGRGDVGQRQGAVGLMGNGLGLDAAQHRRAAALVAVGMR